MILPVKLSAKLFAGKHTQVSDAKLKVVNANINNYLFVPHVYGSD